MVDRDDASIGEVATPDGRGRTVRRWWRSSLATQAIALQIVVIAVVVLAGSGLALLDARRDGDAAARQQVVAIATALADSPSTAAAIESGRATRGFAAGNRGGPCQHRHRVHHRSCRPTERASPTPIRTKSVATTSAPSNPPCAAKHSPRCTRAHSARRSGPSCRCATAPAGSSAWCRPGSLSRPWPQRWRSQWPTIAAVSVGALAISMVGVWAIRRRLLRQTHGLRPDELRVMYEHHDAILHSVSEGLIVLDRTGVALVNDEARRLLGLSAWTRRPIGSARVPAQLQPGRSRRGARHRRPGARR